MIEGVEYRIEPAKQLINWKELWRYRELFYFFTWRDIKVKYKQTVLGFLWVVLQPLMMLLVFTLFFGRTLNIPSQGVPYTVYVFSGLLFWNVFSSGLTTASNSMVGNANIIKKIYFPRLIIPVSSILVALFDFLMAFVLFLGLLIFYRQPISWNAILYWPAALLLSVVATMGIGCWLAALNVKYRDFRYVIPFVVQLLFFVSPIIYPISLLKFPVLQYVIAASPMYIVIELFRFPITGIAPNSIFILISLLSSIVFLLVGLTYFRKTEEFFADFA